MKPVHRFFAHVCVIVSATMCAGYPASALELSQIPQIYGMNFNFDMIDTKKLAECGPRNRAAPVRGHGFLRHYENPEIRTMVRAELQQLRDAGFQVIRTLVFFGSHIPSGGNSFSLDAPQAAARNVAAFARDVRQARFTRLYLSFAPQGTAAPACRRKTWGDCFDPRTIPESVRFITSIRAGLSSVSPGLYVDLQNEGGLTHFHPDAVRRNMDSYLGALLPAYFKEFPADRTTISIQENLPADRLAFVFGAYTRAHRRPSFLDIHIYKATPESLSKINDSLNRFGKGAPLTIGEFPYGNPRKLTWLRIYVPQASSAETPVIFWPLKNVKGRCGVDVGPPYDLTWVNSQP